jgi:hypothetical protein
LYLQGNVSQQQKKAQGYHQEYNDDGLTSPTCVSCFGEKITRNKITKSTTDRLNIFWQTMFHITRDDAIVCRNFYIDSISCVICITYCVIMYYGEPNPYE